MLRALLPLIAAAALGAADAAPDVAETGDAQPAVSLESPRTPEEQVEALAQIAQRHLVDHRDVVDAALDAPQPAVQLAALRALRALAPNADAERARARALIASPDAQVRAEAVRCAGATGDRDAMPALADALADPAAGNRAHDALVALAGGIDLGFDPAGWKAWHDKKAAASADALAALRARLASSDHAEVLAALPTVAVIDLDLDTKKSLIATLRGDADPAVASAAAKVWTAVAGSTAPPPDEPAPAAIKRPVAASSSLVAPVAALLRRHHSPGDIVMLVGLALVLLGATAGILWALYRTSQKLTRAFTRAIAVQLKPKNVIRRITEAIRNPRAAVRQVTAAIRNPRKLAKSITAAIRDPRKLAKSITAAIRKPKAKRPVDAGLTEAIMNPTKPAEPAARSSTPA